MFRRPSGEAGEVDPKWLAGIESRFKPDGVKPWWGFLREEISARVGACCRPIVLDVGCGTVCDYFAGLAGRPGHFLGIDPDPVGRRNEQIDQFARASAYQIPLRGESVDVVIAAWVLEHLRDPEAALREFHRVMKPGGWLFAWTPNLLNYGIFLSRLTPNRFHNWVRGLGHRGEDTDNPPVYYRANTRGTLERHLRRAGFTAEMTLCYGANAYNYWSFSRPLYAAAVVGSRLASAGRFEFLKGALVVACSKPCAECGASVAQALASG